MVNLEDAAGRRLRIAWVGPYDIQSLAHLVPQVFEGEFHPATWIRNAARALARCQDVELHVVTHHKCFARDYDLEHGGIRFHLLRAPMPALPRPLALYQLDRWKYYRVLSRIDPDVVHGHGTENAFSYVAVTSGRPHVISIQAIISDLVRRYTRVSRRMLEHQIVRHVERYTVRRASNVIVKAPHAETFVRSLNARARIYLLENIVHEAYFEAACGERLPTTRIVFVGTIIQTKGVEDLLRAFHALAGRNPAVSLDLIGTGTASYLQSVVRPMAATGAGAGRIRLLGQLSTPEVAEQFRSAAMLVLPSYSDTSPNVVAEAMVAGVPAIGYDVGGIPFMIRHGETGQVVPRGDRQALADAMSLYIDNPALARRHGERAREEGRRRWAEGPFVERLREIYRGIAAARPGRDA